METSTKFERKYLHLGRTKLMRFPETCEDDLRALVQKLDELCAVSGKDRVFKLTNILVKCVEHEIEKARESVTESN